MISFICADIIVCVCGGEGAGGGGGGGEAADFINWLEC